MSRVETEILIPASPEEVWEVALDPRRLADWVSIHKELHYAPDRLPLRSGDEIVQTLVLRGAPFRVTWTVEEVDEPRRAVWLGKGPAGSVARTEYSLSPDGSGTRFGYVNEFAPPGGPLGRIASAALVGDSPRREAENSLAALAGLFNQSR